jgi:hypothetical protein
MPGGWRRLDARASQPFGGAEADQLFPALILQRRRTITLGAATRGCAAGAKTQSDTRFRRAAFWNLIFLPAPPGKSPTVLRVVFKGKSSVFAE